MPPARRGRHDVILAPRGAAKSTLVSLVFPIHALVYRLDPYILLISATLRQATRRLANLRAALLDNADLRVHFAEELRDVSARSNRALEVGPVRIEAWSAGTELRGVTHGPWRPTWIILDDVERSDRVAHGPHRDALVDWFLEVIENLGNGYTNIDVIGTLLHRDALPARLLARPDFTGATFRSILHEAREETLWQQWRAIYHNLDDPDRVRHARAFFDARREAMEAGSDVLWRGKEDYYDLRVLRERLGRPAFDKEKQNAPWADDAHVFDTTQLRRFAVRDGLLLPAEAER